MEFRYTPWWSEGSDPVTVSFDAHNVEDLIAYTIQTQKTFWELELLEYVAMVGPRGGIYVDVGGNIGNHAVFFGLFCADHVVSIEPHPALHPIARANLDRNGLSRRATVVPVGINHAPGRGVLTLSAESDLNVGKSQVTVVSSGDSLPEGLPVELRTLDDVMSELRPALPVLPTTFLKIDVEGMEISVLRSATELLRHDRPQILVELITPEAHAAASELLDEYGYREMAALGDPPSYYFVDPRRHTLRPNLWHGGRDFHTHQMHLAAADLQTVTPADAVLIMADADELEWAQSLGRRTRLPFPEDEDQFAGHPDDDQHALAELAKLRARGATHFVVAWPALWYLDIYRTFADSLSREYRCVLDNQRLVVFEL